MAYIIKDWLKKATKEADSEKALKEAVEVTVKDKGKAAEDAKEKAKVAEKARALTEQRLIEADVKLGGT